MAKAMERVAVRRGFTDPQIGSFLTDMPGIVSLGHVSGNSIDLAHCPFCGSGAIIARSDGTVECSFCSSVFTVQVQPAYSAYPQNVNGAPVTWPGQPDDGAEMAPDGSEPLPGGDDPDALAEDGTVDPSANDDDDDDDNPFAKKSAMYRTASGALLSEKDYIDHLAIRFSGTPAKTAAAVKRSR